MNVKRMPSVTDNPEQPEFRSWKSYQDFEQRVRQLRRYIWDKDISDFLQIVLKTAYHRDKFIQKGSILWRAQVGIDDWIPTRDEDCNIMAEEPMPFSTERMKPPLNHDKEGRANPTGIPVLYCATTQRTAISETRPWIEDEISLARVKILRDLKAIDLSQEYGKRAWHILTLKQLNGQDPVDAQTKEKSVWIDIDNAFSRPVTLSEGSTSYVPTQILAESFRDAGYDAIIYRSHFGETGCNVAIFDLKDADIINCAPYEIKSIEVKFEQIGTEWYSKQEGLT